MRARPVLRVWPDLALGHAGLPAAWVDLAAEATRINSIDATAASESERPDIDFLVSVRYCGSEGNMIRGAFGSGNRHPDAPGNWRATGAPDATSRSWYDLYRGDHTVVFGHWADRGLVNTERLRGIDTGCVWGGRLTAWIAEEDRFVSVAARKQYQTP